MIIATVVTIAFILIMFLQQPDYFIFHSLNFTLSVHVFYQDILCIMML